MAVEDILSKIRADADEAGRGILAEAKREADAVLERAREKAAAERARLRARAKQRSDEERNRIVTLAKLSARRELLNEKQGLIDRVFDETRKSIIAMPADEYGRFIRSFLKRSVETGDEEVIVGEGERRIDQKLLDDVSRERGTPGGLKLSSERRRIDGGFILRRGRTETNCALDTILRDARERLETDVAGILFGREGGR
jgi:V/A-type H+/Na+-transporting ATPase subunit E